MKITKISNLISELRRRHVFKMAVGYIVVAWLMIEVAELLTDAFNSPDWVIQSFIIVMALGFPVCVLLAWAFELTPTGIKLDEAARSAEAAKHKKKVHDSSIVLLPLENIGHNKDDNYISEALTEDLTTLLSRTPGLYVIARNTSNTYKGRNIRIRDIAEELGIRYVIEGKLRHSGESLRVNIQLIDGESEEHLWAERFDFLESELFGVQLDIATRISSQLSVSLSEAESQRARISPAQDLDSWLLVARANHEFFSGVDYQTYQESMRLIQQALELDSDYVYARALNACLVTTAILLGFHKDLEEGARIANADIQKALKQAPNDPMVLWCWAIVQGFFGDKPGSIVALERAKDGNPNGPHILAELGNFLMQTGRVEEGLDLVCDAIDLSPREPRIFIWHYFMGHGYSRLDPPQLDKSLIEFDKSLAIFGNYIPSWTGKFMALHMCERHTEARETFDKMFELNPNFETDRLRRMVKMAIAPEEAANYYVSIIDFYEAEEDRKISAIE